MTALAAPNGSLGVVRRIKNEHVAIKIIKNKEEFLCQAQVKPRRALPTALHTPGLRMSRHGPMAPRLANRTAQTALVRLTRPMRAVFRFGNVDVIGDRFHNEIMRAGGPRDAILVGGDRASLHVARAAAVRPLPYCESN